MKNSNQIEQVWRLNGHDYKTAEAAAGALAEQQRKERVPLKRGFVAAVRELDLGLSKTDARTLANLLAQVADSDSALESLRAEVERFIVLCGGTETPVVSASAESVKKRRGRPSKTAAPASAEPAKKRRGRPAKAAPPVVLAPTEPAKKRRGRPAKSAPPASPVEPARKRRGRPAKTAPPAADPPSFVTPPALTGMLPEPSDALGKEPPPLPPNL